MEEPRRGIYMVVVWLGVLRGWQRAGTNRFKSRSIPLNRYTLYDSPPYYPPTLPFHPPLFRFPTQNFIPSFSFYLETSFSPLRGSYLKIFIVADVSPSPATELKIILLTLLLALAINSLFLYIPQQRIIIIIEIRRIPR
jgi:hypothetical protein